MPLHLLHETLPFISIFSSWRRTFLFPDYDESGEPIFNVEEPTWHEVLTLFDHVKLCLIYELYLFLHALFIALTDNGNDEIHKYNVADNHNEEPQEPCQDFELSSTLNYCLGVVVTDGLPQYIHEIWSCLDSFVALSRFIDNDLGHDGETSYHKKEIEQKDKELFENNDHHFYQEADFSPYSDQKAELDETEDNND